MSRVRAAIAALIVGACALSTLSARAGFLGSTVKVDNKFPNLGTLVNTQSAIVGAGVEFPFISGLASSIDVSDSTILLTRVSRTSYSPAAFSGPVFTFIGAPTITGVTLAPSSTIGVTNLSFTANTISVNLAGQADPPGTFALFNVTFAPDGGPSVPLPAGAWAGLAGCLALAGALKFRRLVA